MSRLQRFICRLVGHNFHEFLAPDLRAKATAAGFSPLLRCGRCGEKVAA